MENYLISLASVTPVGVTANHIWERIWTRFYGKLFKLCLTTPCMPFLHEPQSILLLFWICFQNFWPWTLFFGPELCSFSFTSLFIIGRILSVPWFPACVPCKVLFFSLLLWSYYFRLFARLSSLPLPALHPGTAARVSGCFFSYLLTGLLHLLKAFAYNLSRFCYFHYAVMYCYFIPMSLCVCVCVVCTCMCVYWGRIFLV